MAQFICKSDGEKTRVYILDMITDDRLDSFNVTFQDKSTESRDIGEIWIHVDVFQWLFDRSIHNRILDTLKEYKGLQKLDITIIAERDMPYDDPDVLGAITVSVENISRDEIM